MMILAVYHQKAPGFAIGGRRLHATALFCDIRGFTAMSEEQSPEGVIELLNTYYTLMFDAIASNGGIVTLMVGDGLMAVFGAPKPLDNPAQCAVSAAQDMLELIAALSEERIAHGEDAIKIGIGIATGEVVAGYAGTDKRATYTCVGHTVNLAARLEAHTKVARRALLVDGVTMSGLAKSTVFKAIEPAQFKGFSAPTEVFAIDPSFP